MAEETRYHMLRPAQIVKRRAECPIAWIPLGTLEWHGEHNAVGADTLQAEGLALRCAKKGGGLVFPPLYYGESRIESLVEATHEDRAAVLASMALAPDSFDAGRTPFPALEQVLNYQKLLIHILSEAEQLGFEVGVLVAGHYPLLDIAQSTVLLFNKRAGRRMLSWAFTDYLLVRNHYPQSGDHAGGWETSHMMALHPETVDLSLLPSRGEKIPGVNFTMDPHDSTGEFGDETLDKAAELAVTEARHRLSDKQRYFRTGMAFVEGAWRTPG